MDVRPAGSSVPMRQRYIYNVDTNVDWMYQTRQRSHWQTLAHMTIINKNSLRANIKF
jgi:hypothetical protein